MSAIGEWRAALELTIATNGADPYKKRFAELYPDVSQRFFGFEGWRAVCAQPYMDAAFRRQLEEQVKSYKSELDADLAKTPFGVPPSLGSWGGSAQVSEFGARMYFLHKAFPQIVGPEYTLRAANYILGTHPVSSTSYVSSIGTVSKLKGYGNNRSRLTAVHGAFL